MHSRSMFVDPVETWVLLFVIVVVTGVLVLGAGWFGVTYRSARGVLLIGAVLVGAWFAHTVLRTPSGYLAALLYGQVLFLIALLVIAAGVVAVIPKSRRYELAGLVGAGVMVAGFVATYVGGYYLGFAAWVHDGPVPLQ
jgi:hypothetical protein